MADGRRCARKTGRGLKVAMVLGGLAALFLLVVGMQAEAQSPVEFVAVGSSGKIFVSSDGQTFSRSGVSSGTSSTLYDVTVGDGRWVAVGTSGTIRISDDGRNWRSPSNGPSTSNTFYGVAFGGDTFVIGGSSGSIYTSPDGDTWNKRTSPYGFTHSNADYDPVNGVWVMQLSTSSVVRSTDGGVTWKTHSTTNSGTTTSGDIAHDGMGRWVHTSTSSRVEFSDDGRSWTSANSNYPYTGSVRGVGHDKRCTWVAVGFNGIATSPDGNSWTSRSDPSSRTNPTYYEVVYHPDLDTWVAVSSFGEIAYSTTGGTSWHAGSGGASIMYAVAATAGRPQQEDPMAVDDPELLADGVSTTSVHLNTSECTGGDSVTFSTDRGTLGGVTDNNDGTYSATLTSSTVAGTATIEATFNGVQVPDTAQVEFVHGPPVVNHTTFEVEPQQLLADGSIAKATLRLYDQFNNSVEHGGHWVRVFRDFGDLTGTVDHNNGSYSAEISSTVVGTANLWATVEDQRLLIDHQVEFLPGPMGPASSTLAVDPAILPADGSTGLVTLQLRDVHGNPTTAPDAQVEFFHQGTGNLDFVQDQGDGTYTAVISSTATGVATVSAEVDDVAAANEVTVEFRHDMPDPKKSRLTAPAEWPADGSPATVVLELFDANGNRVDEGGFHVLMATDLGSITQSVDQGDGTYTAELSSNRLGLAKVTAQLQKQPVDDEAKVDFMAGDPHAGQSTLEASPTTLDADGVSTSTVTLRVFDEQRNPLKKGGHDVEMTTDLGTLSEEENHGDGSYSAVLTSATTLGTAVITATLEGAALDPVEVAFVAGPPAADQSSLTAQPSRVAADGETASTLLLELRDAHDNPVAGHDVQFTADLGVLGDVVDQGDGSYTAPLRSLDPGTATVTAFGKEADVEFTVPDGLFVRLLVPEVLCVDETVAIEALAHHDGAAVTSWAFDLDGTDLEVGPDAEKPHRIQVDHTFGTTGTKDVALTVTFADSTQETLTGMHEVRSCGAPEPDFIYSVEGMSVRFTDKSLDPDGMMESRHWDFGDGGTSTEATPVHTYTELGQFLVRLTLVDAQGVEHTAEKVLVLTAPDAAGGETSQGDAGGSENDAEEDEVSQDAGASQDDPVDDGAGTDDADDPDATTGDGDSGVSEEDLLYADFEVRTAGGPRAYVFTADVPDWTETVVWEFSDGGTQIGRQVEHRFAEDRAYTVRLVATGAGQTAESVQMVSVMASAPVGQVVEAQPVHGSGDPGPDARPAGEASLDGRSLTVLMGIALGVLLASVLVLALLMRRTWRRED